MIEVKPYIVIPNLIAQPTWGGKYIAAHKGLPNSRLADTLIGQSYELYRETKLSRKYTSLDYPTVEFGQPNNPEATVVDQKGDDPFTLQQLIDESPTNVLGSIGVERYGEKMDILIKYTQSLGNSFQLHVSQPVESWVPKPESWFFIEPGSITLGIKPNCNWDDYEAECIRIDNQVNTISNEVIAGKLTRADANAKIQSFLSHHDLYQFVNKLAASKNTAVDLSAGGIHHSWEDDPMQPWGNVVYEIQKNVYDPASTIRSFDKGKLKPDGTTRHLQIDDYFKYIDRSTTANDPSNHLSNKDQSRIFTTPPYSLDRVVMNHENERFNVIDKNSFHHVFVQSGSITVITNDPSSKPYQISQGFGIFIPACIEYAIQSTSKNTIILNTFVE